MASGQRPVPSSAGPDSLPISLAVSSPSYCCAWLLIQISPAPAPPCLKSQRASAASRAGSAMCSSALHLMAPYPVQTSLVRTRSILSISVVLITDTDTHWSVRFSSVSDDHRLSVGQRPAVVGWLGFAFPFFFF
jgi:hypothetical protein